MRVLRLVTRVTLLRNMFLEAIATYFSRGLAGISVNLALPRLYQKNQLEQRLQTRVPVSSKEEASSK